MTFISFKVWRMLPCGNIRHTSKQCGIKAKEIFIKYFANAKQLLRVDGWFVE